MSRYQMPTRRKVTETIEEAYKLQFQQIKKELNEDADFVNVTTDIISGQAETWEATLVLLDNGVAKQLESSRSDVLPFVVCLEAIPVKTSTLISRQCLTSMEYQQRCLLF